VVATLLRGLRFSASSQLLLLLGVLHFGRRLDFKLLKLLARCGILWRDNLLL